MKALKATILGLGIFFVFLYGDIPSKDKNAIMLMKVQDRKGDSRVSFGNDVMKVSSEEGKGAVNIDGIGDEISKDEIESNGEWKSEVSFANTNPMIVRAGQEKFDEHTLHIKGTGVFEVYELTGQDVYVEGVKNKIRILGNANQVFVKGVANKVSILKANKVKVEGVGNRCFYKTQLVENGRKNNGLLNLVWHRDGMEI